MTRTRPAAATAAGPASTAAPSRSDSPSRLAARLAALARRMRPGVVRAHCDTEDGPAVTAGRTALETGDVVHALAWIPADGEAELRAVFDAVVRVRAAGGEAAELADRLFLETLVRIHRMGEGVGFTGIKAGAATDPVVVAADAALVTRSDDELLALVPEDRRAELHTRFETALGLQGYDPADLVAARRYVAGYVDYVKYAEGHDHAHGHEAHGHAHAHDAASTCGHDAAPAPAHAH